MFCCQISVAIIRVLKRSNIAKSLNWSKVFFFNLSHLAIFFFLTERGKLKSELKLWLIARNSFVLRVYLQGKTDFPHTSNEAENTFRAAPAFTLGAGEGNHQHWVSKVSACNSWEEFAHLIYHGQCQWGCIPCAMCLLQPISSNPIPQNKFGFKTTSVSRSQSEPKTSTSQKRGVPAGAGQK